MSWLKLDDGFGDHPKVLDLSDAAFRLHVRAMCWVARQETDGVLTPGAIRSLFAKKRLVDELEKSGLWERNGDSFSVHDYLIYNPSRAKLEADRNAAKARQNRFRNGVTNAVTNASSHNAEETPLVTPTPARPDPTHIDPDPPNPPRGEVLEVWEFWKQDTGKLNSKLDDKRRRRIEARLREGATVEELKAAIRNRRNNPHLMGKNDTGMVYDKLETLLRDRGQVEKLASLSSPSRPMNGNAGDLFRENPLAVAAKNTRGPYD